MEAFVLAFETSESRLGLCGRYSSLMTAEMRLFWGDGLSWGSCRTESVPFGTMDTLWGSGGGEEDTAPGLGFCPPY